MPLYEYYCKHCNGIFEAFRPMSEAGEPVPCVECNREAPRIMSSFNAFTFREGYPRRIPDKGTYWHLGREVKHQVKRMKGWEHPELAEPKPKPRPLKGEVHAERDKKTAKTQDLRYRDRWGVDEHGFRTVKAATPKRERKTLGPDKAKR